MLSPRLPTPNRGLLLPGLGLLVAVAVAGCREDGSGRRSAGGDAPSSVRETFEILRACWRSGSYGGMRPYLHPSGREGLIDLLIAVDELSQANATVLTALAEACPEADVSRYDLASILQNNLELFSRDVKWVDLRESGDTAIVTVQIAGRLPLRELRFECNDDVWQYVPGPEDPRTIEEVRRRSRRLRQIALSFQDRRMTPQQVDYEFKIRLGLKARRPIPFEEGPRMVAETNP
ncbi:MAG TPA: hypothetical protein PL151_07455 [Phycisphaerae bacterium]|nr:hypothetical protein [Phycisphaerae bacterium]HOJ73197.1 hypothetical protein [Phycisphaerae bacterium]HOM51237.1 hypothetical protein [Phycisphaerae bacterium]HON68922.1 hypothetical protein [Phycisphaerae bacterium]HOQ88126.1 hypothetical protein [Phycisphaerae bacterium]